MKNSTWFTILLLYFVSGRATAQTLSPKVLPSNGGISVSGSVVLSYTFGETFQTTLTNGTTLLTQGEQQPEVDLVTGTASSTALCTGNSFLLAYTAVGKYANTNVFTAQLSNASGSFSGAVNIGSVSSSTSGVINCLVPAGTPAGNNYRVRVVSNLPSFTGTISAGMITINNAPPSGTLHVVSAPAAGCVGGTDVVSVNAVQGAVFYNWVSSQAGILFNGNPSPYQTASPFVTISYASLPLAGASGWSVCVFAGNACGNTNSICTWIRAVLSTPSLISGPSTGCPGTAGISYSTSAVAGAASYVWTGSGGITVHGSGLSITADFSPGFSSGTLCVHAQSGCGYNSPDRCITISRVAGIPGIISGASYVCPNSSSSYAVAAVTGAAFYNWSCTVPGAVVTPAGNTCTILFPANIPAGSTVSVASVSTCGFASALRSKGIASGLPNTPGNIYGLTSGQCGQTGVSYSINPVSLATGYNWTVSGSATINGPDNLNAVSIDFPTSFSTTNITVRATNSCGMGNARNLTVLGPPSLPGSLSGNTAVCYGSFESYATPGTTGASSYSWTVPGGATIIGPATGSSVLVQWGSTGGTISARAENNCGISAPRTLTVSVTCRQAQHENSSVSFTPDLFPNPNSGKFNVKFFAHSPALSRIVVFNSLGQMVASVGDLAVAGVNITEIDCTSLPKGIYHLVLYCEEKSANARFAIE